VSGIALAQREDGMGWWQQKSGVGKERNGGTKSGLSRRRRSIELGSFFVGRIYYFSKMVEAIQASSEGLDRKKGVREQVST